MKKKCEVVACPNPQVAHGLCWKHYARQRRHGSVHSRRIYRAMPECRFCGTKKSEDFYPRYKGICRTCRKLRSIQSSQVGVR